MILTIIFFIILLGALVLVHEWGHFIVARRLGVRVEEFAFGFPPRLASVTRRGTRYALNLFPLGGYVKIFGEGGEGESDPESFSSRPVGERLSIIAAGVIMNAIFAWLLFSLGHGLGLPTVVSDGEATGKVTIVGVATGSPADKAGLRFGDAIEEVKSKNEKVKIQTIDEVQKLIGGHRGDEILMTIRRGNISSEVMVVPRSAPPSGEGPLGIAMARVGIVRSPWWRAPWDGLKTTASSAVAIIESIGRAAGDFFSRGAVSADVSGPVGIFVFADESRRLGFTYLLELAGILSVNLALLNILPVPALDGGRILFLFIEKLRGGAKMSQRLEQAVHTVGFVILLALMAAVTYRDIVKFF